MRHARRLLALSLLPAALSLVLAGCGSNSGANKQEPTAPEFKMDPAFSGGAKDGKKAASPPKQDTSKPRVD